MPSRRDEETLREYIGRLGKYLSKLPANEREEALREIRHHLDLLIEDKRFVGSNSHEAIQAALQQFGNPKRIAWLMFWENALKGWRGSGAPIERGSPLDRFTSSLAVWTGYATWGFLNAIPFADWRLLLAAPVIGVAMGIITGLVLKQVLKLLLARQSSLAKLSNVMITPAWWFFSIIMMLLMTMLYVLVTPLHTHINGIRFAAMLLGAMTQGLVVRILWSRMIDAQRQQEQTNEQPA
jgi:uncharacterized membrane protein